MKDFTIGLEFIDGNYDIRRVRADNVEEAIKKAIQQNNALVGHPNHSSVVEAISGTNHG